MPSIGSDHFPVMTTLQYAPEKASQQEQNAPTAAAEDSKETESKIEEGKKEGEKVSKEHADVQRGLG
jgi:hypothetical protein